MPRRPDSRSSAPTCFSLAAHRDRGGSLEEIAGLLEHHGMRCFEISALMVGTDEAEAMAQADDIAALAEVLRPDWILTNVMEPLDDRVAANLRSCARVASARRGRVSRSNTCRGHPCPVRARHSRRCADPIRSA